MCDGIVYIPKSHAILFQAYSMSYNKNLIHILILCEEVFVLHALLYIIHGNDKKKLEAQIIYFCTNLLQVSNTL